MKYSFHWNEVFILALYNTDLNDHKFLPWSYSIVLEDSSYVNYYKVI